MKNILLLVLLITFSCQKSTKNNSFKWLHGTWINHTEGMECKETWQLVNDTLLTGESFIVMQKDTVFYENMKIQHKANEVFLKVWVKDENENQSVAFKLIDTTQKTFVFENKQHDFPQQIIYKKVNNDSIEAKIWGIKNGKTQEEFFRFKRLK